MPNFIGYFPSRLGSFIEFSGIHPPIELPQLGYREFTELGAFKKY